MPSHLFPAYPSYRWGAVVADRSDTDRVHPTEHSAILLYHSLMMSCLLQAQHLHAQLHFLYPALTSDAPCKVNHMYRAA